MAEWSSDRDYATRVDNLRGVGTGPRLNELYYLIAADSQQPGSSATVFDDESCDLLIGCSGTDWFFANLVDEGDDGPRDLAIGLIGIEMLEDIDWGLPE